MRKLKFKLIYNRKNKLNSQGKALIQLRITKGKEQKYISTGIYITPVQWNEPKQVVVKHQRKVEINRYLGGLIDKIEKEEYSLLTDERELDLKRIDKIIHDMPEGNFLTFMDDEITKSRRAYETIRNYKSCYSYLEDFGQIIKFADLTYQNIEAFDIYLKSKKLKQSTVHKQHKVLNSFIRKAVDKDMLKQSKNPYNKFRVDNPNYTDRRYLTDVELKSIEEKDFSEFPRILKVRDLFVFSCYTGLGYIDLAKFSKNNIVKEDGTDWIVIHRAKTNEPSYIPIFPKARAILEKYNYELPKITNQKINLYLKEIQEACKIKQPINFYMARHTFATTVTLSNNVPIETVSKMLGHTNIKTTQIYAKILKSKIKKDTEGLMN